MAEKHEKAASLMARAVLKLREQDKVDAVGAIEELLHDDDDAPQVKRGKIGAWWISAYSSEPTAMCTVQVYLRLGQI
jgi:hypothetical protein